MKKIIYIISGILIFLVFAAIIANTVIKNAIEKKLGETVKQLAPFIEVKYAKPEISFLQASIQLNKVYISYNPELNAQHQHKLFLPEINISGIHYLSLVFNKNFLANAINIPLAEITLDKYLLDKNDTIPQKTFTTIKFPFKNVTVKSVHLLSIQVTEHSTYNIKLCEGDLSISNFTASHFDEGFSKNNISYQDASCNLRNITYAIKNYHAIHIKSLSVDTKDSTVNISSLQVIPQLGKLQLGEKLGHQADHVSATVSGITITGLQLSQLKQRKIIANEINIHHAMLYAFRDRRLPRLQNAQPMPLDYLKQIPFYIFVKHLKLSNAGATYEEFPKEGSESGILKITHVNISMSPFFNHATKTLSVLRSNINASIMDAGTIHATIDLSLNTGIQQIKGAIENLNLPALNSSAENLGRFHIQSGLLNNLSFQFTAGNQKASGEIVGVYHNLIVDKLKKNDAYGKKIAGFPSFMLHHFIIPKNKDASLPQSKRTGKIDYVRDPTRFITFYYLKALLSG